MTRVRNGRGTQLGAIPGSIWSLGFVSMFMDISSEMIHSLLPVFLVSALGASAELVGLIEGLGEATAAICKLFSGWISDRLGKRKSLATIGYALSTVTKPLFAIAPAPGWVLIARFSDRVGKGIRGAPRDALIGDLVPEHLRGSAYGLRQSLDTVGAFVGPLLAMALMSTFNDNFRLVFWIAGIPGLVAVLILVAFVAEPAALRKVANARLPIRWSELGRFGAHFWIVVVVGAILTLARISEAFLVLRAVDAGLTIAFVPLVLIVMNIVYALSAYPLGSLSDRVDRRLILAAGFIVLILADLVLAFASTVALVMLGIAIWGLHMGMTQGLLAALVADTATGELRATAFGVFNFVSGIALLLASLIAGWLWQAIGPSATFLAGSAFVAVGLAGAAVFAAPLRRRPS